MSNNFYLKHLPVGGEISIGKNQYQYVDGQIVKTELVQTARTYVDITVRVPYTDLEDRG
jgi:hypothetical protein